MHRRTWAVLALVVLAGCGSLLGGGGGDDADDSPDGTVTAAPVPEVTPTPERWPIAPGVSGAGVVDADALVAAHLDALGERSYTWRAYRGAATVSDRRAGRADGTANARAPTPSATELARNATVETRLATLARVESPTTYSAWTNIERVRVRGTATFVANYSEFADGERRYVRYRLPGEDEPRFERPALVEAGYSEVVGESATSAIRRYLTGGNATVAETLVDGRRHYEVVVRDTDVPRVEGVRSYRARAVVSPGGFVRRLNVSYVAVSAGTARQVGYHFAYTRIGETTVDEPGWVAEQRIGS